MREQARTAGAGGMDEAVRRYRDEMASEDRPVFDRLHQLIAATCPDAELVLSYGMPAYRIGRRRLSIGAWNHGLSLYVSPNRDGGDSPCAIPSWPRERGRIRLRRRRDSAARIPDAELHRVSSALPWRLTPRVPKSPDSPGTAPVNSMPPTSGSSSP